MTRNAQAQPKWLSVMTIGFATALMLAPSAAWAGSGHNDYDRHRADDHYWSQSAYHHDASHKHQHHASHKRHPLGKLRGYEKHHVGYYCRPCDRHFRARGGLYDHVAYRHRVPKRYLEVAVDFGEFGWIFFGG